MLFILSGFLFYGVREKRRAVPYAVAFGAALSVGAMRAGVRRARGISDGSENPDSSFVVSSVCDFMIF